MSLSPRLHPTGSRAQLTALLGLLPLLSLSSPGALLSDQAGSWQLESSMSEVNGGSALLPTGFIPSYINTTIGGKEATALDLAALPSTHWLQLTNGTGGNGGGSRTNNWTLLMDVMVLGRDGDAGLIQTSAANGDDADLHIGGGSGVSYDYYEFDFAPQVLPDFDALTPVSSGTNATIDLSPGHRADQFGFRFRGRIQIDLPGDYTFHTTSDDGSRLFINGALVVDNDGLHSVREASGTVTLPAGVHDLEVTYFESSGDSALSVEYEGPGVARQTLSGPVLSHGSAGSLRFGATAVSDPGAVLLNRWQRLVITGEASGSNLICKAYLDGVQTSIGGGPSSVTTPLDGDWSLGSVVNLFTDDDGETQPIRVAALGFWGDTLSASQVAVLGAPHPAGAPAFWVTNSGGGGTGTLRDAIANAPTGGLIAFDLTLDGAVSDLTSAGAFNLSRPLSIDASGLPNGFTLDGANDTRIMSVATGVEANVKGLTFINAESVSDGAAIRNDGILCVERCVFIDNQSLAIGGAVASSSLAQLIVIDSTFTGNIGSAAGALQSAGTALISGCTFYLNTGSQGGAIENDNVMTVINSTIVNNTATGGDGGGILTLGNLTVISSTIVGNDTCFGFSGGGGISVDFFASATLDNCIVALNTNCGSTTDNLVGIPTLVGFNITSGDPKLSVLGDFGGPTQTMVPLAGSPAAGAGQPTANTPFLDQRGSARILGTMDIGAAETSLTQNASAYNTWATANITSGENSFEGDAERDGASNGSEYAFRLDPMVFDSAQMPRAHDVPDGSGGVDLRIVFPFSATATDLVYILEECTDLLGGTYTELYRYTVATGSEVISRPSLVTALDLENQEISVTDPAINSVDTYWRIQIVQTP